MLSANEEVQAPLESVTDEERLLLPDFGVQARERTRTELKQRLLPRTTTRQIMMRLPKETTREAPAGPSLAGDELQTIRKMVESLQQQVAHGKIQEHVVAQNGKSTTVGASGNPQGVVDVRVSCSKATELEHEEKTNNTKTSTVLKNKRRDYIKLDKFDGTSPLETFFIHLETCAEYNGWTGEEKLAQLKAALRGAAAQVLLSDNGPLTYHTLCAELRDNFGTVGFETQYESQLKTRRRRRGETLREFYQDIHRLVLLAYPDSKGKLRDKLALESFIEGLNDPDLALKVRNLSPQDLQSAYRTALMLESNQMIVGRSDENTIRRKEARPELRAHSTSTGVEDKFTERLQNLEEKLSGHSLRMDISTRMEQTMAGLIDKLAALEKRLEERASSKVVSPEVSRERPMRIDERQSSERRSEGTKPYRSEGATKPRAVTCFSCGEPGHVSTDCPMQRRKTYGSEQTSKPNAQERSRGDTCYRCGKPGHFGRYCPENNGTKRNEKGGGSGGFSAMKLACEVKDDAGMHHVYLTMKLDGVNREFLLDSGCDMTLLPSHFVRTHEMRKSDKKVHAANGAEIVVMGEVTVELRLGNLCIRTDALVSEFVTEAMLGYDWLVDNDCYWGFRTGQVMIRDQVFPLQK